MASQLDSGALKDHLQRYVASLAQATRLFEASGDPLALDVILENTEAIEALTVELRRRARLRTTSYAPPLEKNLEGLLAEFHRRQARASESAGLPPAS